MNGGSAPRISQLLSCALQLRRQGVDCMPLGGVLFAIPLHFNALLIGMASANDPLFIEPGRA